MQEWPPKGYSKPKRYIKCEFWIAIVAILIFIPVFVIAFPYVDSGSDEFLLYVNNMASAIGFRDIGMLFIPFILLMVVFWVGIAGMFSIALHEAIHYLVSSSLGYSPEFMWTRDLYLVNPTIITFDAIIKRWENIVSILSPFLLLSALFFAMAVSANGIYSATAAIMLAVNAVPSCADVYNSLRLLRMPGGTLYLNTERSGEIITEYVTPGENS